ncbi:oxidoreductase [Pseudoalteromonas citrea]|uniref:Oxidoreductase n=1 Tax=Pseudoalteromonas citrea TaxID=43655 RepID=A0A5S3XHZ6_9GAMM|nr:SDR family NAD(P)-dependent oxidoreductase [Pseudoalteromonas citrea]TMP40793.1 oxidoreductase [Pseudoalteromonas citrea]TMP53420.1 oxidoreductase [Pseudoalteromonas citrea]
MIKKIMITGATDGIGLETAKQLATEGHHLLIHGRNDEKLQRVKQQLVAMSDATTIECYTADLSHPQHVVQLINTLKQHHNTLDVLINNAGVFKVPHTTTDAGLDVRFMVNTIAPYMLMQGLHALFNSTSRIINLSSAAQAPVNLDALAGRRSLDDMGAYAQSKLALTCFSHFMGIDNKEHGPAIIAVNPGSLLSSKMVHEGFGVEGKDISIGADILVQAALSDQFSNASGSYFDNDIQQFSQPHPHAIDAQKSAPILQFLTQLSDQYLAQG